MSLAMSRVARGIAQEDTMAEEFEDPADPKPGKTGPDRSVGWSQVWIQAYTRPSVETYQRLLADPNASPKRAYLWSVASVFVGYGIFILITLIFPSEFRFGEFVDSRPWEFFGSATILMACCLPLVIVMGLIRLMISAALTQLVARLLGGDGSYSQLVYLFGAIDAPMSLLSHTLSAIPFAICLTFLPDIYAIVLRIIAVKTVNNFGYVKATFAYLAFPLLVTIMVICLIVVFVVVMAPEIDALFNDIINSVATPPVPL